MGPFAGGKIKEKNWRPFSVFLFPLRFNSCFSPSYTSSDFQFLTAGAPTEILNTNMYVHAYYELHKNIDQTDSPAVQVKMVLLPPYCGH